MLDVEAFLAKPPTNDCVVYYRAANCYALNRLADASSTGAQVNPACQAMDERFELEPIIETWLPAVPYNAEVYTRGPLPVGFYRVRDPRRAQP
ncbi:MAG TPA: hypothetical protein VKU61_05285 [Candidatus Binatia bacterium]|nr:hypothetical protein [Candidatus Binatia bacterium]